MDTAKTKRPAHRPASDASNPNNASVVGIRPFPALLEWIDQNKSGSRSEFCRDILAEKMQGDSMYRALIDQGRRNIESAFSETELAWLRYSLLTTFWDMTSLPHLWREAAEAIHDAAEDEELPAEIEASVLQAKCGRMGPLEAWAFQEGWLRNSPPPRNEARAAGIKASLEAIKPDGTPEWVKDLPNGHGKTYAQAKSHVETD